MKENVFEQVYKKYYVELIAYASLFLKNGEAHDAVQEVFLSLFEKKHLELEEKELNAYLYRSVQNKCMDAIRHQAIKDQYASTAGLKLLQEEAEYFYTSRNEIEDNLFSKELQNQIDDAIASLPPKGREIFRLHFEHQKTAKEISDILAVSISTVNNHLYSCLKILRKKLT